MDIELTNYDRLSMYSLDINTITLGYEFKCAQKKLSETEFDTFLSDTITHEFLHGLLGTLFNMTTSKLFDTIEHFFNDTYLKEKVFNYIAKDESWHSPITWHNSIISNGLDSFFADYHIDNIARIQSYIITGGK